jgi:(4-O-methyl)-D-glucuronate---lignin esterase
MRACSRRSLDVRESRGWGIAAFNPTTLQPDNGAGLTSYLIGLVNQGRWRKLDDWGTLVAYAWGVGRLIDYYETVPERDATKIGLMGHSRWGKATMVAMAYEKRIAMGFPGAGGTLGAKQFRRHWGQDLSSINNPNEYHWMAGNAFTFMGPLREGSYLPQKVELLPVDGESLIALAAPRPVYVNGGTTDTWSDAPGT